MAKKKQSKIKKVDEKVEEPTEEVNTVEATDVVNEKVEEESDEEADEENPVETIQKPRFRIFDTKDSIEIEMLDKGFKRISKKLSFSFKKGRTKTNLKQINEFKKYSDFKEVE